MDWVYRGFETSLIGVCLGLAVLAALGIRGEAGGMLAIELPMLSVTAPAAQ
ncbi:hypothetical protein Q8W71_05345 [Methylobacterium sp. NEAU 140]|uniref:hypothetical protein n=1 Tax=Methylobacterium sp. NEAU 140 TaxID=3064945 RepID=UPI002736A0F1|nr:hypothetical protein [Methylobacterium sp. NEAU 140]MDP4022038.1 hypothetical protein [Methylobacterium sp. NEAU 140]